MRYWRERRGLTIAGAAETARMSKSYWSRLERGMRRDVTRSYLERIAQGLKIDVRVLLESAVREEEESVAIDDRDIRLFFRSDWSHLAESEKEWIRRAIRIARENLERKLI